MTNNHLWQKAAAFAARAHQHQFRRDLKTPYVSHTFRVTLTVACIFECTEETVLAAALLHDTIEDCDVDYDDLLEAFGTEHFERAVRTAGLLLEAASGANLEDWRLRESDLAAISRRLIDGFSRRGGRTRRSRTR